eukprot:m.21097 g.21097  ORF g.21097 m.21097 type:complete len:57 (+) comp13253_c0_seq1:54-224(+)
MRRCKCKCGCNVGGCMYVCYIYVFSTFSTLSQGRLVGNITEIKLKIHAGFQLDRVR